MKTLPSPLSLRNSARLPRSGPFIAALALAAALVSGPALTAATRTIPTPASPAETARWRQEGRTLPTPELLQPTLDRTLPAYTPRPGLELAGTVKGAASDVLVALTKSWIAAFQKHHPKVRIELPPPYAGSLGAVELVKGGTDFVMVSRELRPNDLTDFQAKFGYLPTSVPISGGTYRHFGFLDAVVFIVHADNPLAQLSYPQLDALLSKTRHRGGAEIRTWGQLGLKGEWADQPIRVWGIKPWNGFEEFVRQRILSRGDARGEWRDDLNLEPTVFPISPAVAKDRYALGYTGLAYVGDGVKLLAVAETATGPAVAPGYEEVALAEYPLSRLCFFNVNKAPGKPAHPILEEFARFILSRDGQQLILDQAVFLPLRGNQAARSRAMLD